MAGKFLRPFLVGLALCGASCTAVAPGPNPGANAQAPVANPIFVAVNTMDPRAEEVITERAVDVLNKYNFEVDINNQLEGTIATRYKVGSGYLEPWHRESVGAANRLESTLQPIRRKVLVHLIKADGGYLLHVEALKEREDISAPTVNSAGGSTFFENTPLRRDLNLVLGQAAPSGWLPLGHDLALEQDILCHLQAAYSR
jgi:hypothetical protein